MNITQQIQIAVARADLLLLAWLVIHVIKAVRNDER